MYHMLFVDVSLCLTFGQDPELMTAFSDPEIMAALQDGIIFIC